MCSIVFHRKHNNIMFSIIFDMHVVIPLTTITFCEGTCMWEKNITKQYCGLIQRFFEKYEISKIKGHQYKTS